MRTKAVTMTKECYFLGMEGPERAIYHKAFSWLLDNSKQNGGWFAVNLVGNIRSVARHPGLEILSTFTRGNARRANIQGITVDLVTKFLVPRDGLERPILIIHPTSEYLDDLDSVPNFSKMMVVPFIAAEVDPWSKRNFARDIDNVELPPIHICKVITTAFKHLTFEFSQTDHISPVQFRNSVCDTLSIIIENGEKFEPQGLQSMLILECGWGPVSAKQAAELAETMLANQKPEGYIRSARAPTSSIFKKWKQESKRLS